MNVISKLWMEIKMSYKHPYRRKALVWTEFVGANDLYPIWLLSMVEFEKGIPAAAARIDRAQAIE
jgi:hypothetical protein